jgi:hypothetical protein
MLLRIGLASAIGLTACSLRSSEAINYNDSRNSGVGAGFMLALGLGMIVLTGANIVAAALFSWRGRTAA